MEVEKLWKCHHQVGGTHLEVVEVTCSVAGEVISEWTPEVVMVLENGTCGGGRVGDALVKVLVGVWGSSISGE